MSDAEKFGHTVGRFFKKIDRTLSFLSEKPRKAIITAAALAVSPIWVGIIAYKAKAPDNVDYFVQDENKIEDESSILNEIKLSNIQALNQDISYFDEDATMFDNLDSEAFFGEKF